MSSLVKAAEPQAGGDKPGRLPRAVARWLSAVLGRERLPRRTEFAALRPVTRVLMTGLSGWIVSVLLVTMFALLYVQFLRFNGNGWLSERETSTGSARIRAPSAYDNIVKRPLFARSRQAEAVAVMAVVPMPPQPVLDQNIRLKGVFMSEGVAKAFLIAGQDPIGVWVSIDGEINGWRVIAIQPDQIVLDGNDQRLVVPLTLTGVR